MAKKKKPAIEDAIKEIEALHKGKRPVHRDKDLIEDGWVTVDEFIEALIPGLREYLKNNWGNNGDDRLNHPVDLFTNASIYMDIACHVAQDFINCRHDKEH